MALQSFGLAPVADQSLSHMSYWTAIVPGGHHLRVKWPLMIDDGPQRTDG